MVTLNKIVLSYNFLSNRCFMIAPTYFLKLMLETIKQWCDRADAQSLFGTMKDLQISFIVKIGFRTAISKKRVWVGLPHKWGM